MSKSRDKDAEIVTIRARVAKDYPIQKMTGGSPPFIWVSRDAAKVLSKYYGVKIKPGFLYPKKSRKP